MLMSPQLPQFEVVIEISRGSFLKRGWDGTVDFVSPFPCPFNSIHKPPAQPVRIEKVLPLPGENRSLI
jgi:hypothetical protein